MSKFSQKKREYHSIKATFFTNYFIIKNKQIHRYFQVYNLQIYDQFETKIFHFFCVAVGQCAELKNFSDLRISQDVK